MRQVVPQRQPADDGDLGLALGLRDLLDEAKDLDGDELEVAEGEGALGARNNRRGRRRHVWMRIPISVQFPLSRRYSRELGTR